MQACVCVGGKGRACCVVRQALTAHKAKPWWVDGGTHPPLMRYQTLLHYPPARAPVLLVHVFAQCFIRCGKPVRLLVCSSWKRHREGGRWRVDFWFVCWTFNPVHTDAPPCSPFESLPPLFLSYIDFQTCSHTSPSLSLSLSLSLASPPVQKKKKNTHQH